MKTLCQTNLLRTFALMAFLWGVMPIQFVAALEIPSFDPPPPTDPTIRGGKCSEQVPVVLLLRSDKSLATTTAYPTFLFFVPPTTASQLRVVIKDSDSNPIYRRTYNLSNKSGILRVSVPSDGSSSELIVGQIYNWEFNLICEPNDRKQDDFVTGTLQRVPLSVDSKAPLSQLSLWQRYRAFEFDGMVMLDALRRSRPKQRAIATEWETWLEGHKLGDLKKLPAIELK